MNLEPDNTQRLRRLIAVKRHERPPRGYFERFSDKVMARILAGERASDSLWERIWSQNPSLQRLLAMSEVLAGAVGVAICGLLIRGFLTPDSHVEVRSAPLYVTSSHVAAISLVRAATPAGHPAFFQVPGMNTDSNETQVLVSLVEDLSR